MLNAYRTPASRNDVIASPTPPTRPPRYTPRAPSHRHKRHVGNPTSPITPTPLPRRENTTSLTTPTQPPRRYNIASPTPPSTRPPLRTYNTASPPPATRPPRMDDVTSPTTPTRAPRRYNTASPIPPTPPPRRENTTSLTTPTQPPRRYDTASPITPPQPPRSDVIGSPITPWRPPIPDITASPDIRFRPPIPDITASPSFVSAHRFQISPQAPHSLSPADSGYHCKRHHSFPSADSRHHRRAGNQPTLNVSPSPPVEVGKLVLFEVVLWQPPPPGWNLQYRFDFGDGTRTDWTVRAASNTHLLNIRKRKLPGPCRNCLDIPRSRHAEPKQSTKMSMLSHRQIRHPARRRPLLSHPRQLPSHPRQLLLTLQSPQLFRQRFLPSRRFRHHRRLCGLRECYGSISPLASPSRGWLLSYTRNGNRKR